MAPAICPPLVADLVRAAVPAQVRPEVRPLIVAIIENADEAERGAVDSAALHAEAVALGDEIERFRREHG